MNLKKLLSVIDGTVINGADINCDFKGVSIDSRTMEEGNIFIALSGRNYDSHDFIPDVAQNKPSAIIVERIVSLDSEVPIIFVADTHKALFEIGAYYRSLFKGKVICITGSAGKTMTKELIYNILSKKYNVLKSEGNKNNHIGVPLTLTKLDNSYDFAVLELGMNHRYEISKLSKICKPDISVITNIGTAHIGNLGSRKKIFKAKMEIIDGMNNGYLVVNADSKYLRGLKKIRNINIIKSNYKNDNVTKIESKLIKTTFHILNEREYIFELNVPGAYLVRNCLLAINVGKLCNVSFNSMKEAIYEYKPLNNRLNVRNFNDNILIDDCYNSNYESVFEIIKYLKGYNKNKLIILGDILELGKYSKKVHKKIGKMLKKYEFNNSIFVGKYMYFAHKKVNGSMYFENNDDLIEYLSSLNIDNSIILVKGSRGMHLEEVIEYLNIKLLNNE